MKRTALVLVGVVAAACAQSADTAKQDETAASPVLDSAIAGATVPQIATFTGHSLKDVEAIRDAYCLGATCGLLKLRC